MNPITRRLPSLVAGLAAALPLYAAQSAPKTQPTPWKIGVATHNITPDGPIWLAGYASRTKPSDGVDLPVFAKALSLDDGAGGRIVMVTLDLVGMPQELRDRVELDAAQKHGLKPHEILLNASHTHSAPLPYPDRMVLERTFSRAAKPADVDAVNRYAEFLPATLLDLIGEALRTAAPGRLEFSQARAGFAMNRRRPERNGFSNNPNPKGPVDHDVPVLKATGADGKLKALLFGYACHNTTLSGSRISGDYAGYAQKFLETSYPGATALFMMGCGGDQNPYPRRGMVPDQPVEELVKQHARALSNAVATALNSPLRPVNGPLRGAYGHAMLDYEPLPAAELQAFERPDHSPAVNQRARTLRQKLERGERLAPLACPIQVLQFGRDLTFVGIAGEVVVDYSLRLKRELNGPAAVWIAGYCNNIFGYLGSRRVIQEGGYEGISANTRILNHPGRFTLDAEDRVVAKVHDLLRDVGPGP